MRVLMNTYIYILYIACTGRIVLVLFLSALVAPARACRGAVRSNGSFCMSSSRPLLFIFHPLRPSLSRAPVPVTRSVRRSLSLDLSRPRSSSPFVRRRRGRYIYIYIRHAMGNQLHARRWRRLLDYDDPSPILLAHASTSRKVNRTD